MVTAALSLSQAHFCSHPPQPRSSGGRRAEPAICTVTHPDGPEHRPVSRAHGHTSSNLVPSTRHQGPSIGSARAAGKMGCMQRPKRSRGQEVVPIREKQRMMWGAGGEADRSVESAGWKQGHQGRSRGAVRRSGGPASGLAGCVASIKPPACSGVARHFRALEFCLSGMGPSRNSRVPVQSQ